MAVILPWPQRVNEAEVDNVFISTDINKTALERRKTHGHLRSINRNMIIHFANQSQTCELLKKKKFFRTFHEKNLWKVVQSIPDWTDRENPYRLSYYIYIYVCVEFLA